MMISGWLARICDARKYVILLNTKNNPPATIEANIRSWRFVFCFGKRKPDLQRKMVLD